MNKQQYNIKPMIRTKDDILYMSYAGEFRHDCSVVGDVGMSEDWNLCPWCGVHLRRRIQWLSLLNATHVEHISKEAS